MPFNVESYLRFCVSYTEIFFEKTNVEKSVFDFYVSNIEELKLILDFENDEVK